jgi:hypothetical protein
LTIKKRHICSSTDVALFYRQPCISHQNSTPK